MWVIPAFGGIVILAYLLFYVLDSIGTQGSNAFGVVNTVGLITVAVGLVVAGIVMRRTSRP